MKKYLVITGALGLSVVGYIGYKYLSNRQIKVGDVDYVNKKVSFTWMGKVFNFTYGSPSEGTASNGFNFEITGNTNNIIQATLKKNGSIITQRNVSVVK